MNAYDIATAGKPDIPWYMKEEPVAVVHAFMELVRKSRDPDIRGLVSMMAEELQYRRLDGETYLGGSSTDMGECIADSEVLMARVLLDHSSQGDSSYCYVRRQLQNIAWYIATEEDGKDSVKNWFMAERRYVRDGLEHLAELQEPRQIKAAA